MKRKISIQLSTLFSKETKAARLMIDMGMLGKLYHARSTGFRRRGRPYVDGYGTATFVQKRNSAGGAMYDMGVYHIANMLYLLGNPAILRISGKTYQETEIDAERLQLSGYDVEELGLGFVRLENNISLDIIEFGQSTSTISKAAVWLVLRAVSAWSRLVFTKALATWN